MIFELWCFDLRIVVFSDCIPYYWPIGFTCVCHGQMNLKWIWCCWPCMLWFGIVVVSDFVTPVPADYHDILILGVFLLDPLDIFLLSWSAERLCGCVSTVNMVVVIWCLLCSVWVDCDMFTVVDRVLVDLGLLWRFG
jgi:hypothetical protein